MKNDALKNFPFFTGLSLCIALICISLAVSAYTWTDPALTAGTTRIRDDHIYELRANINSKRNQCGLGNYPYTDSNLSGLPIRDNHIYDLRNAIQQVYNKYPARTMPISGGSFTDSTLTPGVTRIRAIHITQLRYVTDNATCCGDGNCNGPENSSNCSADCGVPIWCGDGFCNGTETCSTCAADCGSCCGNGTCGSGENCSNCPQDCSTCGDGCCVSPETPSTCPADCSGCGDGICSASEHCGNCPSDCPVCCGDGSCRIGEHCGNCAPDCGPCCPNGTCGPLESCSSCPQDCPSCCSDGICNTSVDCSCPSYGDCTSAQCPSGPVCGNGVKETGEQCDDGNSNDCDACGNDCRWEYCGDGVTKCGEQCDNGSNNGTACTPVGNGASCTYCTSSCTNQTVQNGGWCAWQTSSCGCDNGLKICDQYRACNCPSPSGGGATCTGSSTRSTSGVACSSCPFCAV